MKTKSTLYSLFPALILASSLAQAGGVRMYDHGEVPQASDVADILSAGSLPMQRPKMRGISLNSDYPTESKLKDDLAKVAKPKEDAIGVPVEFAFNSAEIMPDFKAHLDAVAEGIKMADGVSVVVEGHTDAHGPETYNERLSLRRAEAVKRYLVEQHGISVSRLVVMGYGEQAPLLAADPFASSNRRVQFRAAN
jgi:outer membrane protein OmpA-like peptidoglycan-associated protein